MLYKIFTYNMFYNLTTMYIYIYIH